MTRTLTARGPAAGRGMGADESTSKLFGVSFEEDGICYGVCLNRFMMTMAPTADELEAAIGSMIDDHIEASRKLGVPPFEHLPEAPLEYWVLWVHLTAAGVPLKTLEAPPGRDRPEVKIAQQLRAA